MVGRHNDPADRRVVLVDYVEGMHEVARPSWRTEAVRSKEAISKMTDEEALAFVKGLRLLAESLGAGAEEN